MAVVSSEEKATLATALGADEVIVADGELRPRLREASPDGFDVVFDPVGGDQFEVLARSLAWRGRLLVIGFASGSIPAIPANLALLKGASVVGVFWGAFTAREPDRNRTLFDRLFEWVRANELRPHVSMVVPLENGRRCPKRHGGAAPLGQGGTPASLRSPTRRVERNVGGLGDHPEGTRQRSRRLVGVETARVAQHEQTGPAERLGLAP